MLEVEKLSNQELQVIQLRYGVGGSARQEEALEGFSPEQIEELEAQALRKLRRLTLDSFNLWRAAV